VFNAVMDEQSARVRLIRILQDAHAGELAAALAYRAHWRSLPPGRERDEVRRIEGAEWHHRSEVLAMLTGLGSHPRPGRERAMRVVGRFFGSLCFVTGWFWPMYAAGRLEAQNVGQYVAAREAAATLGLQDFIDKLQAMTVEEDRHEQWFGDRVRGHWLLRPAQRLLGWHPPPPTATAEGCGKHEARAAGR
jgi:demethoxyubiquinone hydroxylase (CLK1/Coq7/Cat5 family)